jgi:hypothetical protein
MQTPYNPNGSQFMFALVPTFPSLFFGLIFVSQQGASLTNLSFVFLMLLFSLVSGYFIWVWHTDQLEKQDNYLQKKYSEGLTMLTSYTVELERLLLMMEPKLAEQVLAAKELTEQEVSILIGRFSVINQELKQIFDIANQASGEQESESLNHLRTSVGKVRNEIDIVLEALQFQDRVSQILGLVQTNLATLRETLETIQQQGPERHQKMLKTDEMVANIQAQYETVKHRHNTTKSKQTADEFTLF